MINTRYLGAASARLAAEGEPVSEKVWRFSSPLIWEHLVAVGTYSFEEPVIDGELRPLRSSYDEATERREMEPQ